MSKEIKSKEPFSRLLMGIFVFVFCGFCLYVGGILIAFLGLFISWQINVEYINIVRAKGIHPSKWWIRFVSLLFGVTASLPLFGYPLDLPLKLYVFVFTFGVIGCFFRLILRGGKNEPIATISDIGASVLAFVYVGLLPTFFVLIRELGFIYVIISIISIAYCDIGAYAGGMAFGKTALKPEISPKKTIEGAISGFITSLIVTVILVSFNIGYFNNNIWHGVVIGIFSGILGQFGDLFESLLKRDAGVKDSGHLLQSHGGLLDRLDSYFFVLWAHYFYIIWVVLGQF